MKMLELELRNNPAPFIPGWDGPETVVYGNFDGNFALADDRAAIAGDGGSVRVYVTDHDGAVIANTIVFDPTFRGGGRAFVVPHSFALDGIDSLLVVPGPGGGPVVARFDFTTGDHFDFFAPFPVDYRGGMWVSEGDIDGDTLPEALFIAGDTLAAVDMRSFETEVNIFVGDGARFEETGGTIETADGLCFYIQFGDVVDFYAESKLIPVPRR